MKSDLRLAIDAAPEFTGDVGGALMHLTNCLPKNTVADTLRVEVAKLSGLGLEGVPPDNLEREAFAAFLRSVSNFSPHYSPAY